MKNKQIPQVEITSKKSCTEDAEMECIVLLTVVVASMAGVVQQLIFVGTVASRSLDYVQKISLTTAQTYLLHLRELRECTLGNVDTACIAPKAIAAVSLDGVERQRIIVGLGVRRLLEGVIRI